MPLAWSRRTGHTEQGGDELAGTAEHDHGRVAQQLELISGSSRHQVRRDGRTGGCQRPAMQARCGAVDDGVQVPAR